MLLGDRRQVSARTPMPVIDVSRATNKTQINSESVSFSDGAAGTTQRIKLEYDSVMSLYGERIGEDGDSSVTFGTGTVLTTQVPWRFKNMEGSDNETARLASMENGEWMCDHENGYILGKSATSTSSTTDTVSYKIRVQEAIVNGDISVDVNPAPSSVNADAYSKDVSAALENSSVSKSSSGNFFLWGGRVDSSAPTDDYYLHIIDATSVPSDGATPTFLIAPVKIPHVTGTDTEINVDATPGGSPASSGITWLLSTTEFTVTLAGAYVSSTCFTK